MLLRETFMGQMEYKRARETKNSFKRGTIVLNKKVVPGYPKIPRVLHLGRGWKKYLKGAFHVEEKIDGYNVRFFNYEESIFGATRGGIIDPFTTEKAYELGIDYFFKHNKHAILCGEMIGNTPFTEPTNRFDVKFFVFDIINKGIVTCEEKYKICEEYGLKHVPYYGELESYEELKEVIIKINKRNREGIVVRNKKGEPVFKFVTANSDIKDISEVLVFSHSFEPGFFRERMLRSAMFYKEFGLMPKEEFFYQIYKKSKEYLNSYEKEGRLLKKFRLNVRELNTWTYTKESTLKSKDIIIEKEKIEDKEEHYRITFYKRYLKAERKMARWLKGKRFTD